MLGPPFISNLQYNQSVPAIICISTGQLIELVTWYKNGEEILRNGSQFTISHRILNREEIVIEHTLQSGIENFDDFACVVQDSVGRAARSRLSINGKTNVIKIIKFMSVTLKRTVFEKQKLKANVQ